MPKLTTIGPRLQVAALPWRRIGADVEVLLVTSRLSRHWLIPKGWPMKGKTGAGAAAREALEEAGVRGTISPSPIGRYGYDKVSLEGSSIPCLVDVYALRVEEESPKWREAATRTRTWMPVETAAMLAYEEGLSDLLSNLDLSLLVSTRPATSHKKAAKR